LECRDPEKVALAYTADSRWRNRAEFNHCRTEIAAFLARSGPKELDYRLIKELWAFAAIDSRCAMRMNGMTTAGAGFAPMATRTWEYMRRIDCSAASLPSTISQSMRQIANFMPLGRRPDDHPTCRPGL